MERSRGRRAVFRAINGSPMTRMQASEIVNLLFHTIRNNAWLYPEERSVLSRYGSWASYHSQPSSRKLPELAYTASGYLFVRAFQNSMRTLSMMGHAQHPCNSCRSQMFNGNVVTVRCRNGHDSVLTSGPGTKNGITQHATCATCHIDCRWG